MTRLEARLRYRWQSSASTYSIEIWIIDQWEYEIISNGHRGIGHLDRPVCLELDYVCSRFISIT